MTGLSFLTVWFFDGFEVLLLNNINEHLFFFIFRSIINVSIMPRICFDTSGGGSGGTQLNSGTWYLIPEFIKLVKILKFDVFLFSIVIFSGVFYSLQFLYIKFLSG